MSPRPFLALVAAIALVASCGDPSGDCGRGDAGTTKGTTTGVASAQTPFIGSWTFASGTQSLECGDAPPRSAMPTDKVTITAGTIAEQIVVDDGGCKLTYNVTGTVATSQLGASCEGATIVAASIEVRPNGLLHYVGIASAEFDGGQCTITVDGYLARE